MPRRQRTRGDVVHVPHLVWRVGLSPEAQVLLLYYLRVFGPDGANACTQREDEIVSGTGIARGKYRAARHELHEAGFIKVDKTPDSTRLSVTLDEFMWERNADTSAPPAQPDAPARHQRHPARKAPSSWDRITNRALDEDASDFANHCTQVLMKALAKNRIVPSQHNTKIWPAYIDKFMRQNAEMIDSDYFLQVLDWWVVHCLDPYVPHVQSTRTFCDKFSRIAAAMRRTNENTVDVKKVAGKYGS